MSRHFRTDANIPFVQDGLRDGEYLRSWMHDRFRAVLDERGAKVIVAWVFATICLGAAVVAIAIRPEHWDRTLGLALVFGARATAFAVKQGTRAA